MRIQRLLSVAAALAAIAPHAASAQAKPPILAVFAHPDDERVIGPLLSRLAREGRETHLVIATDGSQGIRDYAKIPAGAQLAAARAKEASCAATGSACKQLHLARAARRRARVVRRPRQAPDGARRDRRFRQARGDHHLRSGGRHGASRPSADRQRDHAGRAGRPALRDVDRPAVCVAADGAAAHRAARQSHRERGWPRRCSPCACRSRSRISSRTRGVRLSQVAVHADRDGCGQRVSGARVERHGVAAAVHGTLRDPKLFKR